MKNDQPLRIEEEHGDCHQAHPFSIFAACVTPTNTPCHDEDIFFLPTSTSSSAFHFPPKSLTSSEAAASAQNNLQSINQPAVAGGIMPTSWSCYEFSHDSDLHDGDGSESSSAVLTTSRPPTTSRSMIWSLWSRTTSLLLARKEPE